MKDLQKLKTILFIHLWVLIIGSLTQFLIMILSLLQDGELFDVHFNGISLNAEDNYFIPVILILTVAGLAFVFGVYKLKVVAGMISGIRIFEDKVIETLFVSGNAFIVSGVLVFCVDMALSMYIRKDFSLNLTLGFGSVFFVIAVGLFLRVVSSIFRIGKFYKEETEMTV